MRPEVIKRILNLRGSDQDIERYLGHINEVAKRHQQNLFYLKDGDTFYGFDVRSASKFRLDEMSDKVIPMIVGIDKNKDTIYLLSASRKYNTNTGTDAFKTEDSKLMVTGTLIGESVEKINQQFFSDGIDLDNFEIINFPDISILEAVKNGAILPLNSRQGIFLPPFVDFALNMSIERETALGDDGLADRLNHDDEYFERIFRERYGFNLMNLLYYDYDKKLSADELTGRIFVKKSSRLVRSYFDSTISGRGPTKIVYGTAPIANFLFANYLIDKMLLDFGANPDQAESNAAHINIGMRPSYFTESELRKNTNSYFAIAGYLLGSSMITTKRAQGDDYFYRPHTVETGSSEILGKGFFRTEKLYPEGILEVRYPHNYIDPAYISNQVIVANKMASDIHKISMEQLPQRLATDRAVLRDIVSTIHSSPEYIEWLGKNLLGLQNETQLEWYKKAVKQCKNIR